MLSSLLGDCNIIIHHGIALDKRYIRAKSATRLKEVENENEDINVVFSRNDGGSVRCLDIRGLVVLPVTCKAVVSNNAATFL